MHGHIRPGAVKKGQALTSPASGLQSSRLYGTITDLVVMGKQAGLVPTERDPRLCPSHLKCSLLPALFDSLMGGSNHFAF